MPGVGGKADGPVNIPPEAAQRPRCRHGGNDPDCDCWPRCPECDCTYDPCEGHDCDDENTNEEEPEPMNETTTETTYPEVSTLPAIKPLADAALEDA